jgi:hypothetical protein
MKMAWKASIEGIVLTLAVALTARAAPSEKFEEISVSPADAAAAAHAKHVYSHARPTIFADAKLLRRELSARPKAQASPSGNGGFTPVSRYPADMTFQGGAIVPTMVSHPIYLDPSGACSGSCWGDPEGFLRDLGRSEFIHVTDAYVGTTASGRYTVVRGVKSKTPTGKLLVDSDIQALVHAVAAKTGQTGYGHEYHVFLTSGTDECFDNTYTVCYSPDNTATWYFCAYHSSVDFTDIGHVLYSVEPYQNVNGCAVSSNLAPNGLLTDSTNSVLSHETFETITDPDGTAWWNTTSNALYGAEIGDECSFEDATGFFPSLWAVDGKVYSTQPEYVTAKHACTTAP